MINIILEPAKNGVIKRINDLNHGGSNETKISVDVYEDTENASNKYEYIMRFFYDLCEDLGFDLGNKFGKEVLTFKQEWGTHYSPTKKDLEEKIQEVKAELALLTTEWENLKEK